MEHKSENDNATSKPFGYGVFYHNFKNLVFMETYEVDYCHFHSKDDNVELG